MSARKHEFGGGRRRNRVRRARLSAVHLPRPSAALGLPPRRSWRMALTVPDGGLTLMQAIGVVLVDGYERETRDFGEAMGAPESVIADAISYTRQRTAAGPTDWAIARAEISASAGTSTI